MTYDELREALTVLGLRDRCTLREVKDRHRELVKRYHHDSGGDPEDEQIRRINSAYRIVSDYLGAYSYSFSEEEFYEQNPEEQLRRQFMDSSLWGERGVRGGKK